MILNAIREAGLRPVTRRRFLALVTTAAVARARPTRGQARVPRVGMVSGGAPSHRAFLAGLRTVGHVPGETIVVEHRPTEGRAERYDGAIASTVGAGVDVLVVTSPHGIMAARRRTSSVPVVAVDLESDPVAAGFVASLARPAGNITGVFLDIPEMSGKLLELLGEAVPGLARVGVRFRDVSAEQPDLAEVGDDPGEHDLLAALGVARDGAFDETGALVGSAASAIPWPSPALDVSANEAKPSRTAMSR